jgi:hypothetical protein
LFPPPPPPATIRYDAWYKVADELVIAFHSDPFQYSKLVVVELYPKNPAGGVAGRVLLVHEEALSQAVPLYIS